MNDYECNDIVIHRVKDEMFYSLKKISVCTFSRIYNIHYLFYTSSKV